jgi:hypothetical protein
MRINPRVPTVAGIQRMTAFLTAAIAAILFAIASRPAASGCLIGGSLMIANFYLLQIAAKAIFAFAHRGRIGPGNIGPGKVGIVVAPLKIMVLMVLVYVLIVRQRIDPAGFLLGVLTQFAAIFIETGRVSIRAPVPSEGSQV